jgi:predicted Zn finger-like uncharacterized protein
MTEPPKTVVCTSCSAKFHVPDELIRGKLVKFRCRKCGEGFDVDGRKSARPPPPSVPPPPPPREVTGVDTPATFSQRTLPPPRPPVALSRSSPNLHPWPEPPRTRSSTSPTAVSDSGPPLEESLPRLDSLPRLETVRDPSNRGPKIAAIVALLIAAGLSGFGLAMRSSPSAAGESRGPESVTLSGDPQAAAPRARRSAGEPKVDDPPRAQPTPTPVMQLPVAVDGVEPAPTTGSVVARPSPAVPDKQEPSHDEASALPPSLAAHGSEMPAALVDPSANNAGATTPPSTASQPPAVAAPPVAARARGDFNTQAARETLEDAAGRAGKCRNMDSPSGTARVAVTFAPSGQVTNAVIESGPFVGTAAGSCVASKFRSARVPPFSGDAVLVRKSVAF